MSKKEKQIQDLLMQKFYIEVLIKDNDKKYEWTRNFLKEQLKNRVNKLIRFGIIRSEKNE